MSADTLFITIPTGVGVDIHVKILENFAAHAPRDKRPEVIAAFAAAEIVAALITHARVPA